MVSKLPDSANWRATSLPMPELAPVISTEALDDAGMPHYVSVDRHLCRCPPLSDTFAQTVDTSIPAKVSLRGGQFVRWSRLLAQGPRTIYDQFGPALHARRPLVNHVFLMCGSYPARLHMSRKKSSIRFGEMMLALASYHRLWNITMRPSSTRGNSMLLTSVPMPGGLSRSNTIML